MRGQGSHDVLKGRGCTSCTAWDKPCTIDLRRLQWGEVPEPLYLSTRCQALLVLNNAIQQSCSPR